jgi:hypothetical protein
MNVRFALCTTLVAGSLALLTAWQRPAAGTLTASPPQGVAADGNYSSTDPDGIYQKALEAALQHAQAAVAQGAGQQLADAMFNWSVFSVTGTRGGITGRHDITVTIHVAK